jgi:DNA-directed RNA polymerase subunit RPC12/RpoP
VIVVFEFAHVPSTELVNVRAIKLADRFAVQVVDEASLPEADGATVYVVDVVDRHGSWRGTIVPGWADEAGQRTHSVRHSPCTGTGTRLRLTHMAVTSRRLTVGQRALLLVYCTDHAITACPGCGCKIMVADLFSELWTDRSDPYRCPRCGHNVAESLHAHLTACSFLATRISTRTRQTIVEERQAAVVRKDESEGRREVTLLRSQSPSAGLARCPVCHRGLSAASDIVIREGRVVHLACGKDHSAPAAS